MAKLASNDGFARLDPNDGFGCAMICAFAIDVDVDDSYDG